MSDDLKATVDSSVWCEKYKPATIDDLLISDELRKKFDQYMRGNDIPHLLLSGSAGNGKCVSYDTEIEIFVSDELYEKLK